LYMVDAAKAAERRVRAQRAKEFLISQVVEEAQRENVSLSEVERKMLYFTETEETLPDIYEVNAQFDREYDGARYEKKIAGLLRNAFRRNGKESVEGERQWKHAVADLRKEDHYLLVMVDQSQQPPSDFWTVAKWSSALFVFILVAITLWQYLDEKGWIPSWVSHLSPRLVLYGAVGIWFVYKFARFDALKDMLPFARSNKTRRRLRK
jgi:hypothetical protein